MVHDSTVSEAWCGERLGVEEFEDGEGDDAASELDGEAVDASELLGGEAADAVPADGTREDLMGIGV